MYLYKVTHIPTRRFYIGLTEDSKNTFDTVRNVDPFVQYKRDGHNGLLAMGNIEKTIMALANSKEELVALAAKYAKEYESNANFDGVKSELEPKAAPKIDKVVEQPKIVKVEEKSAESAKPTKVSSQTSKKTPRPRTDVSSS